MLLQKSMVLAHYYSNTFRFKQLVALLQPTDLMVVLYVFVKFVDSIIKIKKLKFLIIRHSRDFTYIDDLTKFLYLLYKNNNRTQIMGL